ncbi:MAG: DNA-processing protein DprA, partial [Oscillospiraceae bacterium]|nr:DNA-processing protein DprA [Oscillospiraceae bacterium]
ITSGLAVGVLVVEAPEESNCLRFVDDALEQGKDVFVLPGNVDAENCAGNNRLLKEGARPVTAAWDILCEYSDLYRGKLHYIHESELQKMRKSPQKDENPYSDFVQVCVPNPKKIIDKPKPVEYIGLEKQLESLSEQQLKIISAMGNEAIHIDDLIDATGLEPAAMLAELTMLQIEGVVSQQAGKRFTLNIIRGS